MPVSGSLLYPGGSLAVFLYVHSYRNLQFIVESTWLNHYVANPNSLLSVAKHLLSPALLCILFVVVGINVILFSFFHFWLVYTSMLFPVFLGRLCAYVCFLTQCLYLSVDCTTCR